MIFAEFTAKLSLSQILNLPRKTNFSLLLLLALLALFLTTRLYNFSDRLGFDHDQEKAAEAAWSLIINHKPTLIGIETSTGGIFAGPLLNWSHAIFLYAFKLDPIALGYQAVMFSAFAVVLLFIFVKDISNTTQALLSVLIYIISARLISYDISASPISYISLLSILVMYLTYNVAYLKKYFLLPFLTLSLSLGYHVHLTLLLQIPAVILIFLINKTKFTARQIIISILTFLLPLSTYFAFEIRHNLLMTKKLSSLLFSSNHADLSKFSDTVINFLNVVTETVIIPHRQSITLVMLLITLSYYIRIHLNKTFVKETLIFLLTPLIGLLFYKEHIPEYYFLVSIPAALILVGNLYNGLVKRSISIFLIFFILVIFVNFYTPIKYFKNPFSINLKKNIISYIKEDSQGKNISLSYEIPLPINYGFKYLSKWSKVPINNESQSIYIIEYSDLQEHSLSKYETGEKAVKLQIFEPFHVVSIK